MVFLIRYLITSISAVMTTLALQVINLYILVDYYEGIQSPNWMKPVKFKTISEWQWGTCKLLATLMNGAMMTNSLSALCELTLILN